MVHVYTGDGKGKTTAAVGLAVRSAGYGKKTLIIQFMKGQGTGELAACRLLSGLIDIEQFGREEFYVPEKPEAKSETKSETKSGTISGIKISPLAADGKNFEISSDKALFIRDAEAGLSRAADALSRGNYDILILDEALNLIRLGLIDEARLLELISMHKNGYTEIVITGRGATEAVIAAADIVTEMRMVKHCFESGAGAREGIDY